MSHSVGAFVATALAVLIVLALLALPQQNVAPQAGLRTFVWPVLAVAAGGIFGLVARSWRPSGGLLAGSVLLFTLGSLLMSVHHLAPEHSGLWFAGHLLWLVATPLLTLAAVRHLPRRLMVRPLGFALALVDAALMACAWTAMIWRQHLWDGELVPGPGSVPLLWALGLDLFVLMLLLLLAATARNPGTALAAPGLMCLTIANISFMYSQLRGQPDDLAIVLLIVSWPVMLAASWFGLNRRLPQDAEPTSEQLISLITLVNVMVPLGVTFGGLAANLVADRTTIVLTGLVVLIFGLRELIRTRQSAGLVELLGEQATRDPLTGLANRRALADRLRQVTRQDQPASVLILDIDRFKLVNTEFGHSVGDEVLAAVGQALRYTCLSFEATPFRLGGDEFAVVVVGNDAMSRKLASLIQTSVADYTSQVAGAENIGLTASVGAARIYRQPHRESQHEHDPLAVLGRAAEALRVAKLERNRVRLYTQDLRNEVNHRNRLETRLRRAIDLRGLEFHYQPIVDLRSGRIMGMESLARWQDEELGAVAPSDFVPVAEQAGLIHKLGRMAIESALRVATSHTDEQSRIGYIAVNVSPLQLRRPQFVEEIVGLVREQGARPSMLKLEVTEGIFMDHDDPAVEHLRQLSSLGIGIAIDDFGSGYSSLGYMSRLPVETVKVDRVLTSQVDDSRTRSVVRALVWVAEAHGLQVILEGVETEQTAATLRQLGVRWGQGWLWSRAVPETEVPAMLRILGTVPSSHRGDPRLIRLRERQASFGTR